MQELMFLSDDNEILSCERNVSDCFNVTKLGRKVIDGKFEGLTGSEWQLLRLISNKDTISRHSTGTLLHKVDTKNLLDLGLIEQISFCKGFWHKPANEYKQVIMNRKMRENKREDGYIDPILRLASGN